MLLPIVRTLGQNLAAALEARNVTQSELARRIKKPATTVNDWVKDRYESIELTNLLEIGAAIGCDLGELVEGLSADYDAKVLSRQRSSAGSALLGGAVDPAAAARALEERDQLRSRLDALAPIVRKLFAIVVEDHLGGKSNQAAAPQPRRRGRSRAAR